MNYFNWKFWLQVLVAIFFIALILGVIDYALSLTGVSFRVQKLVFNPVGAFTGSGN